MIMNLNSDKKTILIFSDPHQEIDRVEYILKKENYDIVVCLGDWFDSFTHNSEYDLEKTCKFLKKWVFKENFFTCIGNHDIHYLYDNNTTICSGYDHGKDVFISDVLGNFLPPIRDKFKWYIWIDEFLCSHAGINEYHFHPLMDLTKDGVTKWLDEQIKIAEPKLINGDHHWLYGAGNARGGRQKIGGITWQDFDWEFSPIEGINQLVGHTPHSTIFNHKEDGNLDFTVCDNLDIDCRLSQYLLIQNKKLKICDYKNL
jgi:hypothetical protein